MARWRRAASAILFTSGCIVAALFVMTYGIRGAFVGFPLMLCAAMAAAWADPRKWAS